LISVQGQVTVMDLNPTQALDIILRIHGLPQEECLGLNELRPSHHINLLQ